MGECRECEAALLCRELMRLGYSKLMIDPGVRLAYSADVVCPDMGAYGAGDLMVTKGDGGDVRDTDGAGQAVRLDKAF